MRYVHRELRPRLLALADDARHRDRVIHLRSPRALARWRASISAAASAR
jgi:hypothetical protein